MTLATKFASVATAIVAGVVLAGIGAVWMVTHRLEGPELDAAVARSHDLARDVVAQHLRRLALIDTQLGNDAHFRAYVAEADALSVLDSVKERASLYECDRLIVTDRDGRLIADSRRPGAAGLDLSQDPLVGPALEGTARSGAWLDPSGELFLAASAPILQGGRDVVGAVIALDEADDGLALELRNATGSEVAFVAGSTVVGSSIGSAAGGAGRALSTDPLPSRLRLESHEYAAGRFDLPGIGRAPAGVLVVLRSVDRELAPFRSVRAALILVGVIGIVLGIAAAAGIAGRITRPIGDLVRATERIAHGDFDTALPAASDDEVGRLAVAFGAMTTQLKEKEAMDTYLGGVVARSQSGALEPTLSVDSDAPRGPDLGERFEALGLIGRGATGAVWRAYDRALSETVALKLLPLGSLARVGREVKLARKISHRNVVRIHDFVETPAGPAIAMELVDGVPLSSLLGRERLPLGAALRIARQICDGLAAAHAEGVVHRDLKPANVLVDALGRVKIADFGLAELTGGGGGKLAGTPSYMAPEQTASAPVDQRTDIWALGIILYEMLCGRLPFQATDAPGLFALIREGDPPRPRSFVPDLPEALEAIVLKALAKRPAERPGTALELDEALVSGAPRGVSI
ncbi:MAG TPA: protein kinase [Candidatus Polarisedimenticolaceae bacterium]|nr:protein kinase [Candidatus Polarisedimenticolaceae bacterium]